jgi:adenylate cyclase
MADVFVSYSRTDKTRVTPLVAAIESEGWSVWWDPEISPGQEFDSQIDAALKAAAAVVVVWTPTSVTSRWVRGEARVAADRGILVPVRFDNAELPIDVRAIHTTNLDDWGENSQSAPMQELLRALGAIIARHAAGKEVKPGTRPASTAAAGLEQRVAICVLPFVNMSGDVEQEYFSDGISEDVITDLSKVSSLAVVARNTAFTFKGKHVDVPQIARQLKVGYVLEGSVRKAGQRVRINAQLIDGVGGSHVWAERYDRDLNDIFALQDEISQAIVKALKLKLLPEEKKAIEHRGTTNAEAYKFYLMARQHYVTGSVSDLRRGATVVRLCTRAVELDPNYAQAWALMASTQRMMLYFGASGENGAVAAERALALDQNLPEAHAARAGVLSANGELEAAQREIEIALRLDPDDWDVNREAARLHYTMRDFPAAIRHYEKAAAAIDSDWSSCSMLIPCYRAIGDMEGARDVARRLLALAERIVAHEPDNGAVMAGGVLALATLGQTERALEWAERAALLDPDNLNMRYNVACVLVMNLGRKEEALDLLEPAFDKFGLEFLAWAKADTDFDPLRDHPRFKTMMERVEARVAAGPVPG